MKPGTRLWLTATVVHEVSPDGWLKIALTLGGYDKPKIITIHRDDPAISREHSEILESAGDLMRRNRP